MVGKINDKNLQNEYLNYVKADAKQYTFLKNVDKLLMLKKMPLTLQFYRELPKAEMTAEDIAL